MLRSDAISEIQLGLGFSTAHETQIITALKRAQENLELRPFLPWFLKSEVTTASTTAAENRLILPPGFIREFEGDALYWYVPEGEATDEEGTTIDYPAWKALKKGIDEDFHTNYPGNGKPQGYSLDASYFRLYPTPDAVYQMKIVYYKKATVLDTDVENGWLKYAPDLLIGEAGQRIAAGLRDAKAKQYFLELSAKGHAQMEQGGEAREHENQTYVMGGPD